jgi:hypothetical protein
LSKIGQKQQAIEIIYFYGYFVCNVNLVASVNKVTSILTFEVDTLVPCVLMIPGVSVSSAYCCYNFYQGYQCPLVCMVKRTCHISSVLRIFPNFLFKYLVFEKLVLLNATIHHVCLRLRVPGRRDDKILYSCTKYLWILSMERDLVPKILRWVLEFLQKSKNRSGFHIWGQVF